MQIAPQSPGLPGSFPASPEYAAAIDLLAQVIASRAALIAAERSSCRHDPRVIARLQAERAAAIRTAAELRSNNPQQLRETLDRYGQAGLPPQHERPQS